MSPFVVALLLRSSSQARAGLFSPRAPAPVPTPRTMTFPPAAAPTHSIRCGCPAGARQRRAADPGNHALVSAGAPVLGVERRGGAPGAAEGVHGERVALQPLELRMSVHTTTGTHVDAPGHKFQHHFEAGLDVDELVLEALNGPALLVDVQRNTNMSV